MTRPIRLNKTQANRAIQRIVAENPHLADTVHRCIGQESRIVRVRSGVLTSTVGYAIGAAGTVGVLSQPLFSRAIGDVDPVLGTLTEAQTNILTGGKVESSKEFVANRLELKVWFSTLAQAGAGGGQAQAAVLSEIARRTALRLSLGGSDIQRLGAMDDWGNGGISFRGAVGDLAAAATSSVSEAVYGTAGYVVEEPWVFGDNVTLRLDAVMSQITADANFNGSIVSMKCVFRGLELDTVQG